jgi:hypothetical protein
MKRNLAIALAIAMVFYTFPVRAAEEPIYHFFNIGARPVDPNRQIDWATECRVELTEPSPTVRLSFLKNGEVGETRPGNIRSGYVVVVDKVTGFAKWVSLCGNDVTEPKNWIPIGRKECGSEPAPTATPSATAPSPAVESAPAAVVEVPAAPVVAPPASTPIPTPAPASDEGKGKKNGWKTVGNILLGVGIGAAVCALVGKCDFFRGGSPIGNGNGGPAPDPPNGPTGNPPN